MSRKRKAIRKDEYLAAALACLLPQDKRDELRRAKVPAQEVIRLFSPDHIGLHCSGAPDRDAWHNISPMLRPAHAEKSKRDTSIAAKVKRIRDAQNPGAKIPQNAKRKTWGTPLVPRKIAQRKHPWPPRGSRPFLTPRTS